jgi:hypothetical protein
MTSMEHFQLLTVLRAASASAISDDPPNSMSTPTMIPIAHAAD